ncbi:hypothetical protein GCM10010502_32220 [Kitasatospora aureofaciens]|uniref:Uncharacterized protein n=1 Tax=Kitasatospora aureofaciens TaxID=1894 RepID=A0A8H9LRZ8_KITAU|nr:hypothetical protein GCM10010502_32220 [Kitasatospora aureofaciens]
MKTVDAKTRRIPGIGPDLLRINASVGPLTGVLASTGLHTYRYAEKIRRVRYRPVPTQAVGPRAAGQPAHGPETSGPPAGKHPLSVRCEVRGRRGRETIRPHNSQARDGTADPAQSTTEQDYERSPAIPTGGRPAALGAVA